MTRIVNFVLYQVGWFACVLGAAWGLQWLGVAIALCLLGVHFWLATDRALQVQLTLIAAVLGLIIDTLQRWAGVFSFPRGVVLEWFPPPFMTVLWMQFATTFRYCLRWLSGHYWLSACFGFIGAPLAFYAGESLGALAFAPPRLVHYSVLGVVWSLSVPLMILICDRLAWRSAAASGYRWPARVDADVTDEGRVGKVGESD